MSLTEILAARDARFRHQRELIAAHPELSLVVLTIVMPGQEKRNGWTLKAADAAVKALKDKFADTIEYFETKDLETGYEAFLLTTLPRRDAKMAACSIEDSHPLGRIYDIDVLTEKCVPLSRTELGLPSRRCLLCDDDARVCMRLQHHSYDELISTIKQMIDNYDE